MTSHYFLRANSRDYRQLNTIKLPRAHKSSSKEKLYPIEVVEIDGSRGRIHYVGYDSCFDECCDLAELVNIPLSPSNHDNSADFMVNETPIQQYSLHNELWIKIKQCLVCRAGKASPSVTIDMGFDYLLFKGGLQAAGMVKQHSRNLRYKLKSYKDLDPLLGTKLALQGSKWTWRLCLCRPQQCRVLHSQTMKTYWVPSITVYYSSTPFRGCWLCLEVFLHTRLW